MHKWLIWSSEQTSHSGSHPITSSFPSASVTSLSASVFSYFSFYLRPSLLCLLLNRTQRSVILGGSS